MFRRCDLVYSLDAGRTWDVLPLSSDYLRAAHLVGRTLFLTTNTNELLRIRFR
ncbi:MAG: hypothetical protein H6686_02665 [Fibrobacteria bacterium]|nr:hypothetical protein [Fibrobacteria bacterium]